MVPLLQVYPPKPCMNFISPPYATCTNHPVFDLNIQKYLVWDTYHEAPNCVLFSSLIISPSLVHVSSTAIRCYRFHTIGI